MAKIEIYTTPTCPYCHAAKALLADKGAEYTEITVLDPSLREAMTERAHGRRARHRRQARPQAQGRQ